MTLRGASSSRTFSSSTTGATIGTRRSIHHVEHRGRVADLFLISVAPSPGLAARGHRGGHRGGFLGRHRSALLASRTHGLVVPLVLGALCSGDGGGRSQSLADPTPAFIARAPSVGLHLTRPLGLCDRPGAPQERVELSPCVFRRRVGWPRHRDVVGVMHARLSLETTRARAPWSARARSTSGHDARSFLLQHLPHPLSADGAVLLLYDFVSDVDAGKSWADVRRLSSVVARLCLRLLCRLRAPFHLATAEPSTGSARLPLPSPSLGARR